MSDASGVSAPDAGATPPIRLTAEPERYARMGLLGVGGMGRVYLARDRRLGRMVALKEAHDDGLARRLAREVRVTAGLEHPGIVTVYDEGRSADGRPFYTMRLMRGRPLSRVLAERQDLPARLELLSHYLAACQALAYAHAQGVIHRDLKPANLMLGAFGDTQVVDWGLARRLEAQAADDAAFDDEPGATRAGAVLGTPAYMSPEQARGDAADRRSDVWGLGAVLHELVTGAPPGPAQTESQTDGPLAPPPLRALAPGAPAELAAIVTRALAPEPDARYPDAAALAADVAAYLEGRRVRAHRYTVLEIGLRFVRVRRVPLMIAGGALLVIAAILGLGNLRLRAQRDRAVAAESEVRTALTTSDRNLATALVAQARAAADQGASAAREVIAAHALRLVDSPEARGLIAGARAAARPTRLASAPLPECRLLLVALAVDDLICAEHRVLWRLSGGVLRWRVTTERAIKELRVEAERVWVLAPDNNLTTLALATGAPDDEVWDFLDYNVGDMWPQRADAWTANPPTSRFARFCRDENAVGVSGLIDGRYAVLCGDGQVGLGAVPDYPTLAPAFDHADFVSFTHLQLAPDARYAVVAGTRGRVAVHEFASRETWTLPPAQVRAVRRLVISADGERLAIVRERGGVELFELPALRPLGTIPAVEVRDVRLFADGSVLVTDAHHITQWALPGAPRPALLLDEHGLSGLEFAPDGRSLVTTHGEGRVLLWDLATGLRRHELTIGAGTVKDSAFLPDGAAFVVVDASPGSPGPRSFDLATGALRWTPSPPLVARWYQSRWPHTPPGVPMPLLARRVVVLAGNVLIFALYTRDLLAVDLDTDEDVPIVDCPHLEWRDLASAPAGGHAVLVAVDGSVFVVTPGSPLRCRPVAAPADAFTADVSEDGRVVMIGASQVLARSGPEGLRWSVAHPGARPAHVSLSPDGRRVATAGPDDAARVWDAETGALLAVLTGHQARVVAVDFSRDSATLASASWDGAARLWDMRTLDLTPASLVEEAEQTWGLGLADALGR